MAGGSAAPWTPPKNNKNPSTTRYETKYAHVNNGGPQGDRRETTERLKKDQSHFKRGNQGENKETTKRPNSCLMGKSGTPQRGHRETEERPKRDQTDF